MSYQKKRAERVARANGVTGDANKVEDVDIKATDVNETKVEDDTVEKVELMTKEELGEFTFDELMDLAQEYDIPGRSSMNKKELIKALEAL